MGDDVISRVEALLAYDFGDESAHCIALAEAAGELLALACSNRDAEHGAFIRGYLACLSDDASPYKEESAKQMAEDAWLDRLPSPPEGKPLA